MLMYIMNALINQKTRHLYTAEYKQYIKSHNTGFFLRTRKSRNYSIKAINHLLTPIEFEHNPF